MSAPRLYTRSGSRPLSHSSAASPELAFQRQRVDLLQKAEPECVIDIEEGADHIASDRALDESRIAHLTRSKRTSPHRHIRARSHEHPVLNAVADQAPAMIPSH